jgi:hypothetical protein
MVSDTLNPGFVIEASTLSEYSRDIGTSNTIGKKPIHYPDGYP